MPVGMVDACVARSMPVSTADADIGIGKWYDVNDEESILFVFWDGCGLCLLVLHLLWVWLQA